ncbi:type II toxin-antitoxin system PemK/MazF family toxin [Paramicrobacterium humi]|uniref:type II toxin-antitoxin system PemK/MazF family toxin n=1 Tax=Paramicrobacterium humi TaxID=640635 RepID=UPI0024820A3B|nr:type II toxin-antitoxin system PemK/MazF family toxin [Microbacterium humi]
MTTLFIAVPVTTVNRGWPNHVLLKGELGPDRASWAMTEQPRTLNRDRVTAAAGFVTPECLDSVTMWLSDFLDLRP